MYTVDDLWEMAQDPAYADRNIELIEGELIEMSHPGRRHGLLATDIAAYLWLFNREHKVGEVTVDSGYHYLEDRYNMLAPDVAFLRHDRMAEPPSDSWTTVMPDLVVEIHSPSDTYAKARRKAQIYLRNGTTLVWLVQPARQGVEVCRLLDGSMQSEFLGQGAKLSGEEILPGFELEIDLLFPPVSN